MATSRPRGSDPDSPPSRESKAGTLRGKPMISCGVADAATTLPIEVSANARVQAEPERTAADLTN